MRTEGTALKQMSVDDLSEKISIRYYQFTRNSRGDLVKGNEEIRCIVWAKVFPLTGKIADNSPERLNTVTYRITIRYRTDIKPDDEIVWRGRRFKIITPPIDLESRHIWTMFDIIEGVQDGRTTHT